MNNQNPKHKKFINTYEKEIKKHRDQYYKNILKQTKNNEEVPLIIFQAIPIILFLVILYATDFSIVGYTISIIAIIVTNYIIKTIIDILNLNNTNEYLQCIRRNGYLSIEDYEAKIKEYITGPGGYYENLYNELIKKYKITPETRKINLLSGEEYYIWNNSKKDTIYLFPTKTNQKPEVKKITISNVRYYRIDNHKKCLILKTSSEDYYLKLDSQKIITEILKEKKLENIKTHTPEVYIDDFEIYMHQFKSNEEKENSEKTDKITIYLNRIIVLVICLVIGITLSNFLVDYKTLFQIINIGLLIITSTQLFNALSIKLSKGKSEREYLKELNNNPEIIARFEELKYVLGINNKYDRVYTKEGAEYITWLANGYFHVFLNLIYFNVVYMVVKMSDVTYYKKEKNECIIKLKNRTLTFKPEAEQVFKKILPNKDYNWLKGFPKK